MASYPLPCPHCDVIVDSQDSMADTRSDLEHHIHVMHPVEAEERRSDYRDSFGVVTLKIAD